MIYKGVIFVSVNFSGRQSRVPPGLDGWRDLAVSVVVRDGAWRVGDGDRKADHVESAKQFFKFKPQAPPTSGRSLAIVIRLHHVVCSVTVQCWPCNIALRWFAAGLMHDGGRSSLNLLWKGLNVFWHFVCFFFICGWMFVWMHVCYV